MWLLGLSAVPLTLCVLGRLLVVFQLLRAVSSSDAPEPFSLGFHAPLAVGRGPALSRGRGTVTRTHHDLTEYFDPYVPSPN